MSDLRPALFGGRDWSMWQLAIWRLLDYFDAMEGTTYLYDKTDQESFLKEIDEQIRDRVADVLDVYHRKNVQS